MSPDLKNLKKQVHTTAHNIICVGVLVSLSLHTFLSCSKMAGVIGNLVRDADSLFRAWSPLIPLLIMECLP